MRARQTPPTWVIGLGSNLGDRAGFLDRARDRLATLGTVHATSPYYETPPLGPAQPDYLNAAVRLETTLAPEALLDATLHIERSLGRIRGARWGPRTLDLDLLWTSLGALHTPRLDVPHPGLLERPFALAPLLDVLPEAPPELHRTLAALGGPPPRFSR